MHTLHTHTTPLKSLKKMVLWSYDPSDRAKEEIRGVVCICSARSPSAGTISARSLTLRHESPSQLRSAPLLFSARPNQMTPRSAMRPLDNARPVIIDFVPIRRALQYGAAFKSAGRGRGQ